MNIIIKGAGFVNKGAEAMARTVQTELTKRLPECEFFLWRPSQRDCRPALDSGFSLFRLPFEKIDALLRWRKAERVSLLLWCLLELCRTRDPREMRYAFVTTRLMKRALVHYVKRSTSGLDALVDVSGFCYGDEWGIGKFRNIDWLMSYFRHNGKPVVFLPQAWGSFDKPQVRQAVRHLLISDGASFYSRDEISSRFLEQALEKPIYSIPVTPDIVFGFQGGTAEQGEHILRGMGCSLSRPIIGIAPNMNVYRRVLGKGSGNRYLKALLDLITHCQATHDVDIVLQANVISSSDRLDDRYLCGLVAASVGKPERCFTTRQYLTAEEMKALIGRFDYLIGSRFHSLVFGLSQGIPGMAVSWSHKYRELFSLFGMEDAVHECQNLDAGALIETFEKGWAERHQQRMAILGKAQQLQDEVSALFDRVADTIHRVAGGEND